MGLTIGAAGAPPTPGSWALIGRLSRRADALQAPLRGLLAVRPSPDSARPPRRKSGFYECHSENSQQQQQRSR